MIRPQSYLKVRAADKIGSADAPGDILEDMVERVRDDAAQLRWIAVALHGMRLTASGLWMTQSKDPIY